MDKKRQQALKKAHRAFLEASAFFNACLAHNWQKAMTGAPPPKKLTPKTSEASKPLRKRKAQCAESKQQTPRKKQKQVKPKAVMLVPLGEEKAPDPPPDDAPDAPDPEQVTAPDSPSSRANDILKKVMHVQAFDDTPNDLVEKMKKRVKAPVLKEAPVPTPALKKPETLLEEVLRQNKELKIFKKPYNDFDRFIVSSMGRRLGYPILKAMDNKGAVNWDLLRSFELVPVRRSEAKSMYSFLDFMARGSKEEGDFCTLREKIGQCLTYEPYGTKERPMTSYEAILRHKHGTDREFYILVKQGNRKAVIRFRKKYHLDNIEGQHLPLSKARV